MKVGLDSFSYHLHFGRHGYRPKTPLTLEDFVQRAAELGCAAVQLDPAHHNSDPGEARAVGQLCASLGLALEWGMGGFDPPRVREQLALAQLAGARVLRTFIAGERPTPAQLAEWLPLAVRWFGEVMPAADEYGVTIALENHGDLTTAELLDLIRRVDHPRFRACLDVGNNWQLGEAPLDVTAALAPYAASVHLKDGVMDEGELRYTALGDGEFPLLAIWQTLVHVAPCECAMIEVPSYERGDQAETLRLEACAVERSVHYARTRFDTLEDV